MTETLDAQLGDHVRRWKPYPAYKDSGVEWLGAIPEAWSAFRLGTLVDVRLSSVDKVPAPDEQPVSLCNYTDVYRNERIDGSLQFMRGSATPKEIDRFALRQGDVLITKDSESWTDIGVPAAVVEDLPNVVCGYHLALLRSDSTTVDGRFLAYTLQAHQARYQFSVRASGITRFAVGSRDIKDVHVSIPQIEDQRLIAVFLDRETTRIDVLIAKKQHLLYLLRLSEQSLIHTAITCADVANGSRSAMKPWFENIPPHWQARRLMHLTQPRRPIMYGIVLPGPNVPVGIPIVKGGDVEAGRLLPDLLSKTTPEIEAPYRRARLAEGDLLYAIRGSIGAVAIAPKALAGANITQDVARIAPAEGIDRRWLLYALRSKAVFSWLEAGALGATIRGINIRDLKRATIPVPPPAAQRRISADLDHRLAGIQQLSAKVQSGIAHLREFRSALISAAVTGKIDVREAV